MTTRTKAMEGVYIHTSSKLATLKVLKETIKCGLKEGKDLLEKHCRYDEPNHSSMTIWLRNKDILAINRIDKEIVIGNLVSNLKCSNVCDVVIPNTLKPDYIK